MHAAGLTIHFIGERLAAAEETDPKHAIKQVVISSGGGHDTLAKLAATAPKSQRLA
jgi:hypothetical protein